MFFLIIILKKIFLGQITHGGGGGGFSSGTGTGGSGSNAWVIIVYSFL